MLEKGFYLMDCMDAMREFPDKFFELSIVDPPYQGNDAIGIVNSEKQHLHAASRKEYKAFDNVKPTQEYFDELKRVSKNWIVWGGNFFGLSGGVIAWNKHGTAFGEGEVAICSTHKSVRFFDFTWNGMIQGNMKNKEERIHSCQKPVALYLFLLNNYAKQGDKILDTHVGSASSLIACHRLGFDYWGFELDAEYYKAASERLAKEQAQQTLFSPEEIYKPQQQGLRFDE